MGQARPFRCSLTAQYNDGGLWYFGRASRKIRMCRNYKYLRAALYEVQVPSGPGLRLQIPRLGSTYALASNK